ncbi:MAG: Gx transporter family protein [Clostridiales bacterium]|jgi:heptaprenyl diphosphate synthase|nr:Gx transporter family protein [Clostridiales bacterium]
MSKKIAFLGLMLAIMLICTALEHMLPPIPFLPPNVRLGLANIALMFCVFFVSRSSAITLNALKAFFVLLTRGPIAGVFSLCGGLLSVCVIILLLYIFREKISYTAVSVAGATAHNFGQFAAFSVLISLHLWYLPVLIIAGIATGIVTGTMLKILLPVIGKIRPYT